MSFKKGDTTIKRPDKDLILMGIFEDQDNGILMIENRFGLLQIPGGKIKKFTSPNSAQNQLEAEILKLQKVIFEKSGLLLDILYPKIIYDINGKFCKIFILTQNSTPLNGVSWKRDPYYHAYYIFPDQELITGHPAIPYKDKIILLDYLVQPNQRQPNQNRLCLIKTIA